MWRSASSSAVDAAVSFAITRTWLIASVGPHRLGMRRAEDRVPRTGDAVLVRVADDLRDLVEVEDRRRRADLPLERERAPRVALGDLAVPPRVDHVVEEHE